MHVVFHINPTPVRRTQGLFTVKFSVIVSNALVKQCGLFSCLYRESEQKTLIILALVRAAS